MAEKDKDKIMEFELEELEQKVAPSVIASCSGCSNCSGCGQPGCSGCTSCS